VSALPRPIINELRAVVGDTWVVVEEKAIERYLYD
jgi:hypothetical protein